VSKPVLRVVLDTNAFTPERFDLLANGPLVQPCRAGRIVPVYGHVFLEEMWRAYGNEKRRPHLVERWIPFIAATVHRFCEDFITIWHSELVQGLGLKTNFYMRPRDQKRLLDGLAKVPLDGSWPAWHRSEKARAIEESKRAAQREVSKDIRQEIADWRKAVEFSAQKHGKPISFVEYLTHEIDRAGRDFICALVKCHSPAEVANRWSRDKAAYPFFTAFVRNMAYLSYYAATRPNDAIDLNAQADLDLMTHLLHGDALVSNETGFLRKAFDDLWRTQRKVIFTSEEFAEFVKKLA
jgi:hypothetical protein